MWCELRSSLIFACGAVAMTFGASHVHHMPTGHFLRAWRKHSKLTLAQAADAIELHLSVLAKIEAGKTAYTQPRLEALAKLYKCHPADLLHAPPSLDSALPALLMAIRSLSEYERQKALALLQAAFDKLSKAA